MKKDTPSRRLFLQGTSALAGSAWLSATMPTIAAAAATAVRAASTDAPFALLTVDEARTLAAIAAQIIPSDDQPGATEANVVYFFDTAFGSFMEDLLPTVREQLPVFETGAKKAFRTELAFSQLDETQQIEYLTQQEDSPLFGTLQFLTTLGMFAMPKYGGNRDHAGWDLIGFKHQHVWFPPFGHYDAEYAKQQKDTERG
ncbi:MAG: gluconate 2-dehydrogenase subunit 3 family protein [Gammaproteobacteria bacterium]